MANIPDLVTLLNLDARRSVSPFGGKHRTILISKDLTNTGDFVFNNLLHHFARKEPTTPMLLVTLSHGWSNYSAIAAKCGFNLRRSQNGGNIEVLDMMSEFLNSAKEANPFNPCDRIVKFVSSFIERHTQESENDPIPVDPTEKSTCVRVIKPIIIMIDDLSILMSIHPEPRDIFRMFLLIDKSMRSRSNEIQLGKLSHLIVQTMIADNSTEEGDPLKSIYSNMENLCDLSIILRPLETGYSTRVDGTIKIVDNRKPADGRASGIGATPSGAPSLTSALRLPSAAIPEGLGDIGTKRALFYKLGDRRVRLTTSALIF